MFEGYAPLPMYATLRMWNAAQLTCGIRGQVYTMREGAGGSAKGDTRDRGEDKAKG